MTIKDLLEVWDYDRESDSQKLQICRFDCDWDEYDECLTSSMILVPLYSAEIKCMEAIDTDTIRIDIDWEKLDKEKHIFGWDKEVSE